MTSILVIRLTSLGDVILTTPVIAALRRAFPDAGIDVAVDAAHAEVWKHNPHIRSIHCVRKGDDSLLDLPSYDLVVDLQRNRRSSSIIRSAGRSGNPQVVRYAKHRLEKLAFVYLKRKPDTITHIVSRYAKPLEEFGLRIEGWHPELYTTSGIARRLPRTTPSASLRIGIAPGAQHATKRYPVTLMALLLQKLVREHHADVVLVGGPADAAICDAIEAQAGVAVTRCDGAATIAATLDVLCELDALVSCDSAAVHMASACGLPVTVIYGSTAPEFGFTPYLVPHAIVQQPDLPCRPCSHIGRADCPKGHFQCMNSIDPAVVAQEVIRLSRQ